MMQLLANEVRPWLPGAALARGEIDHAIAAIIARWAAEWLEPNYQPRTARQTGPAPTAVSWCESNAVSMGISVRDATQLARTICGGRADPGNARDLHVLGDLARTATEALAACFGAGVLLAAVAPQSATAGSGPGPVRYQVQAPDRQWVLILALGHDALVRARRAAAGGSLVPELGRLADALAPIPCSLAVPLGTARIATGDLETLAHGDVILLDQAVAAPLPLLVNGTRCRQGRIRIDLTGDEPNFVMVSSIENADERAIVA